MLISITWKSIDVVMSLCRDIVMSWCLYVVMSLCRDVIMSSLCRHYVVMSSCRYVVICRDVVWHSVKPDTRNKDAFPATKTFNVTLTLHDVITCCHFPQARERNYWSQGTGYAKNSKRNAFYECVFSGSRYPAGQHSDVPITTCRPDKTF